MEAHRGKLLGAICAVGLVFAIAPAAASAGTITVNQFNDGFDDNGLCSLREAISAAQGNGSFNTLDCDAGSDDNHDTIRLAANNTFTLSRVGEDNTNVNGDLDIVGTGSGVDTELTIESTTPGTPATIQAVGTGDRVLQTVTTSITQAITNLTINDITITGGSTAVANGGGLQLTGFTTATLNKVVVTGNSANSAGGLHSIGNVTINTSRFNGNDAGLAGGIWIEGGNSTINRSTIDNNSAGDVGSGGLAVGGNFPNLTVKNSTIAQNDAIGPAGGVMLFNNGTLTLSNATVAANTADLGQAAGTDDGGGISQTGGTLNSRNTIVGDNVDVSSGAPDCAGTISSQGYNLIESTAGCTITTPNNELTGVDPRLNALQGSAGHWTMPLLTGSPAFNGGNPATPTGTSPTCETVDQFGNSRPFVGAGDDICDIGAVEMQEGDSDNDKQFNGLDNCTNDFNPGQENHDGDAQGDACDGDDDNDGISDGSDSCATGETGWTSNSGTDSDSDGCRDATEDADDDNDTVPDTTETGCPGGGISTDTDSDDDLTLDGPDDFPCDSAETTDTDGDGVGDNADNCDAAANPGQQDNDADAQGDACDPDDDNDTIADGGDNCPLNANTNQANNDGDAQGDACDGDDDNDGVADTSDGCRTQVGPASNSGCPLPAVSPPTLTPTPTVTPTPAPTATGQRAAALKKCKKKRTKRARRKCRKRANKLPV